MTPISFDDNFIPTTINQIIEKVPDHQLECCWTEELTNFCRIAYNQVEQHDSTGILNFLFRALDTYHQGVASTNLNSKKSLENTSDRAWQIAKILPKIDNLPELPNPYEAGSFNYPERFSFFPQTADFDSKKRIATLKEIKNICEKEKLQFSGILSTKTKQLNLANSKDLKRSFKDSEAILSLTLKTEKENTVWAQILNRDIEKLNYKDALVKIIQKAKIGQQQKEIPSGKYTVILEPAAVASLLLFLSFSGFGGKSFVDGHSFMARKIDQKVTSEKITITDKALHPSLMGLPFDYEGMLRKRVVLIEKGVAKGVVFDRYQAARAGKDQKSTGHALPADNDYGPYPQNMLMIGGSTTLSEIIKNTSQAILITRFWYTNFLNPMETMVTGMTRDGTIWIENGKMISGVKDMRFTTSILEAFSNVEEISEELTLTRQFGSTMLVPALKIKDFSLSEE